MITEQKKQNIKLVIALSLLILIIFYVVVLMIKYQVEGETSMPFKLSKIVIVGTAEGVEKAKSDFKWDFSICQNNDIYFYIDENENLGTDDILIKNVVISNIQIVKAPKKGNIKVYMPNSEAGRIFTYDDQFLVQDKLTYKGASQSSSTNLEIGSKGGQALIRFSNTDIGNYSSDEDKEIVHNGSLLTKIEATQEEITSIVSFDFTIETTKNKYLANITLELPTGDLTKEGNTYMEKTDMSDIIFKRVK